jgi:hypothetical protein
MNLHVSTHPHVSHALRRDKDKLSADSPASCFNHHLHTDIAVYAVHEDVTKQKLVEVEFWFAEKRTIHPDNELEIP